MKRLTTSICCIVLSVLFLMGCTPNKALQFNDIYHQVIGFSDNDDMLTPVPQDAILLLTNEDYNLFMDEYFTSRALGIPAPDPDKAVLFIQIPSDTTAVKNYSVKNINVKNNVMTIDLDNGGESLVEPAEGFTGTFKWVMFIEIDKTDLQENTKLVINK